MPKKKTHEEFVEEMKIKNPNIKILGKYINSNTKIKCKCKVDGYTWDTRPADILRGTRCPKCSNNIRTHEEFIKEMKIKNPNIEILGTYINTQTKIKCRCLIDGYTWDVIPNNLLKGTGCRKCAKQYRRTHKEFIEEMKNINPNIEILGEFKKVGTKIKCKCKVDGYIWEPIPNNILRGQGCPKCGVNKTRKTHEKFIEEMKVINPNIEILGRYTSTHTKIQCKCRIDEAIWEPTPHNLLQGSGCPKCAKQYRRTHEEFIEEMKIKNPNIKILGEFKDVGTKIKCECLIDKNIWEPTPNGLLIGQGCPKCAGVYRRTHEEFIEEMKVINSNIEILGEYINNKTKIKCKCSKGHIWEATPNGLLSGSGCSKCAGLYNRTHEEFTKEMKLNNPDIEILGEFINTKTRIKCRCLIDNYIWETMPQTLLKGHGCPKCKASKGEKTIEKYCKNNYLQYISQYKIDKCRNKRPLPFDFALFNKNKLVALIEYQGKQHYEPVNFSGKGEEWANDNLKETKKKDKIKRDYCLSNNIPLIEIPYWIRDIESYLEEEMDKMINKPLQLTLV